MKVADILREFRLRYDSLSPKEKQKVSDIFMALEESGGETLTDTERVDEWDKLASALTKTKLEV